MIPNSKTPELIFFELQPLDVDERDFRLHLRADTQRGIKELKRWMHRNLYRRLYYYDAVAEYYTIKQSGKTYLKLLESNSAFTMVQGIRGV